jgi:hypothetical protein
MQLMNNGFNTFKLNDSIMCKCWWFKRCEKFTNPFKYKFETLSCCACFNIY